MSPKLVRAVSNTGQLFLLLAGVTILRLLVDIPDNAKGIRMSLLALLLGMPLIWSGTELCRSAMRPTDAEAFERGLRATTFGFYFRIVVIVVIAGMFVHPLIYPPYPPKSRGDVDGDGDGNVHGDGNVERPRTTAPKVERGDPQ